MNMRILRVAALVAAVSSSAWPADPWTKPSSEWTLADTTKVLFNSPWVRDARVPAPWLKGEPTIVYPVLTDCSGRVDRDSTPSMGGMSDTFQSIVVYRVSWVSSRAYREARARRSVICGEAEQDDIDALIDQGAAEDYVIKIESPDMKPFEGVDEATIKQNTTLTGKKSGLVTPPIGVQPLKMGSTRVVALFLRFPKSNQEGKPIVIPGETELALSYKWEKTEVKVRFLPEKMKLGGDSGL